MKSKSILAALLALGIAATNLFAAPKNGDLIQNSKGGVFLIKDGKRCGVPSAKVFVALGYKWESVTKIPDAELEAIPQGADLIAPYKTAKDGDLIKGSKGAVFLVRDGKRCRVANVAVFNLCGFKGENVIAISDADLNAIPEGDLVRAPYKTPKNGDAVKASGDGIFLIKDGKRCGIESPEKFKELGLKWENVINISDEDFEAIPEGEL